MTDEQFINHHKTESPFFYGYLVVTFACVIMIASYGAFYSFGIFFKPVLIDFGWTRAMTSGAFSLATIISGIVAIPAGRLTDRFGSRLIMITIGIISGIGYLMMSQINSIFQLKSCLI